MIPRNEFIPAGISSRCRGCLRRAPIRLPPLEAADPYSSRCGRRLDGLYLSPPRCPLGTLPGSARFGDWAAPVGVRACSSFHRESGVRLMPTEIGAIELKVHGLYKINEGYKRLMGLDPSLTRGNRIYGLAHGSWTLSWTGSTGFSTLRRKRNPSSSPRALMAPTRRPVGPFARLLSRKSQYAQVARAGGTPRTGAMRGRLRLLPRRRYRS